MLKEIEREKSCDCGDCGHLKKFHKNFLLSKFEFTNLDAITITTSSSDSNYEKAGSESPGRRMQNGKFWPRRLSLTKFKLGAKINLKNVTQKMNIELNRSAKKLNIKQVEEIFIILGCDKGTLDGQQNVNINLEHLASTKSRKKKAEKGHNKKGFNKRGLVPQIKTSRNNSK